MVDLHQDLYPHEAYPELFQVVPQTSESLVEKSEIRTLLTTSWRKPPDLDWFHPLAPELQQEALEEDRQRIEARPGWEVVLSFRDLHAEATVRAILHVEGLNVWPENGLDTLDRWMGIGMRSIGPVWSKSNWFGGGDEDPTRRLTRLGAAFLEWAADRSLVVDFAHMGDATFWDAVSRWKRPIVVTHGNSRTIHPKPRNLTDEQLSAIGNSGGVVGLTFAGALVAKRPSIHALWRHACHIEHHAGSEALAIGSDFGGIGSIVVRGLSNPSHLPALNRAFARFGMSPVQRRAMFRENATRILTEALA